MVKTLPVLLNEAYDEDEKAIKVTGISGGGGTEVAHVYYYNGSAWVEWQRNVSVLNFPTEFPLPAGQVSDLKDIRQLTASDVVTVNYPDDSTKILNADDAVTTINYTDSSQTQISNVTTSSATIGKTVTDTFSYDSTSIKITRSVS